MKKKTTRRMAFHHRIHHHIKKHVHKHVHHVFRAHHDFHHHMAHIGELIAVIAFTLISGTWMFANLTGYSEELYRNNSTEVAEALVEAMKNPGASLKKGNIISIRKMDTNVENTFAKGYCTYGAARISPEFFPYLDSMTQQRTWGGNAVNRCENAAETGYKIGMTPVQGALIVYDAGGRFGIYGHVGKVMHHDASLKKIIVRDMARVARSTMSDRREDITTANVKCYIYNNKQSTEPPVTPPVTPPVIPPVNPPVTPPVNPPVNPPVTPPVNPPVTPPVTPPVNPPVTPPVNPISLNDTISLKLEQLSDIAKHFLTQYDMNFSLVGTSPLKIGESARLTLEIKNKTTGKPYAGLLPFSFGIISTNDILKSSVGTITFVNDGKIDISILGQHSGKSTIAITMDGMKIGEFVLEVK